MEIHSVRFVEFEDKPRVLKKWQEMERDGLKSQLYLLYREREELNRQSRLIMKRFMFMWRPRLHKELGRLAFEEECVVNEIRDVLSALEEKGY